MTWLPRSLIGWLALVLLTGCDRPKERVEVPEPSYKFLGLAEDESSDEGPVGLIGGQAIRVSRISQVVEAPYADYRRVAADSKIVVEQRHEGFVYWAVQENRDVPFENATAWVTVLERFKSPLPQGDREDGGRE